MKSIIISSNSSGGGKTTFTLGLMRALKNRGLDVQGFKVGPDYIDPAFHSHITEKTSRNLDLYLMGEKGVRASYSRGKGDVAVIEGVMGLYDGIGISSVNSTAELSRKLNLPIILVISPKAQCATLCAQLKGLMEYEDVNIAGVVLNNINKSYYMLLKTAIEKNCTLKVFGYLPVDERLSIKSRHLGLIQSSEIEDLNFKINICAELIEQHVDLDELLKYFKDTVKYRDEFHVENREMKIGIAYDKAFSFYYKENIELLRELGEIHYFSPLKDKYLPKNLDFLYLGGGYPEVFIQELMENVSLRKDIKKELDRGLSCYAECGGLMYLMESINGCESVGFFKGKAYMTKRLQNFGYAKIEVNKENNIMQKGFKINCHEFHRSTIESNERTIYKLTKSTYNGSVKEWECGYIKNNTLGAYAHTHFFGNMDMINFLANKKGSV